MKHLILILMTFAFAVPTFAVKFPMKKAPRSTAATELISEVQLLKDIVSCVQKGKSVKDVHSCAKNFFPATMSKADRHRLLAWFEMPYEVSYPEKCAEDVKDFLPEEMKAKAKTILCANYNKARLNKKVLFFIGDESGSLRLLNIKD